MDMLIERPTYENLLMKWSAQPDLVKIVTGVRRCGKSKLLELFQRRLVKARKARRGNFITVNFEDFDACLAMGLVFTERKTWSGLPALLAHLKKRMAKTGTTYIFLDEIQLLDDWPQAVNALRLKRDTDVYLTGSNAYMFSSDLANMFGGRFVTVRMLPFSLAEFARAHPECAGRPDALYQRYVEESGFPQLTGFPRDPQLVADYLRDTVFTNTVQKDIVRRFNIADTSKLDDTARYIFNNIGNETSLRGIEGGLKASGRTVSAPTVDLYLRGLLESFLVYKCDRYDIRGKRYLNSGAKYYVADCGLRRAVLGPRDTDWGHILENVVYLELLRRGYAVYSGAINTQIDGTRKTLEVDFVAVKSTGETEYYQVALYALEPETHRRELASLRAIPDNHPKFLLSTDPGTGEQDGIIRKNVFDWLLESNADR